MRQRLLAGWRSFCRWLFHFMFAAEPNQVLARGFGMLILVGTLLLLLPWAHHGGVGVLEAFFTSVSAVCVTGLIVVDTGSEFTLFGQLVILLLIQLGGLGIMTFAAIAFRLAGARLPLGSAYALDDTLFQHTMGGQFRHWFGRMLRITAAVEGAGFIVLFFGFLLREPVGQAFYAAFFHSISAFCNAGFSIYRDSLEGFAGQPLVLAPVMSLIVLGGLGHVVLLELHREGQRMWYRQALDRPHRFSYHTRIVLLTTAALLVGGLVLYRFFGVDGDDSLLDAAFMSVTTRTAGFNTVGIGALPLPSILLTILLMYVGGSPGGCAGGMKTTSVAIWFAALRSGLLNSRQVRLFGRSIPEDIIQRTLALVGLSFLWNALGVLLLSFSDPDLLLRDLLFEQISAFGTVGLSTGITAELSPVGQLWIAATMFVGRLGPLTLVFTFVAPPRTRISYPVGKVMIG